MSRDRKANKKSTPVENKKDEYRNKVSQSTEASQGSNFGLIAIIVIVAIIVLGLLFFSDLWV